MGTRILAVEDDERIRTAVRMALEDEGWEVDEAGSGEEAIGAFQRQTPDVVLIDIMLPGIDGFELCRNLRRHSDVPIVMVTARNDTHDVVAGLEAGMHTVLVLTGSTTREEAERFPYRPAQIADSIADLVETI